MKRRQKARLTKISVSKEPVTDKKPDSKENDIFSIHNSVSSLEASSISSSSPSQLSAQDMCFEPISMKDNHISDTWIENEPSWESFKKDKSKDMLDNQEEGEISMKQDSQTSSDDSANDSESTHSSETRSESHVRDKPIQKKRSTQKYINKTKLKWSIWQTIIGWFGKQSQDETLDA
ncbi:hypothetical protein GpartN1_g7002.t1 [Galdieria partita]|uniref:Uncharacterized protein n=1 Tax=Galdieria partita TaxID=83374 RepID=A0A9C7Q4L6_9RHOD|nr:hypothetical protein GpartN1_g6494.t1 [Galdieria partita]GJQ15211.1 hypothetical protein GpartN1_g7002.t1 [Galdieria partita]